MAMEKRNEKNQRYSRKLLTLVTSSRQGTSIRPLSTSNMDPQKASITGGFGENIAETKNKIVDTEMMAPLPGPKAAEQARPPSSK